jgi:GNAT superfamily N-acetyltransferase
LPSLSSSHGGSPLSEFYRSRRAWIKDLTSYFGFVVGFLGSGLFGWQIVATDFESGHFDRGVLHFLAVIFGSGMLCGIAGLGVGAVLGWGWERYHRLTRGSRAVVAEGVAARAAVPAARSAAGASEFVRRDPHHVDAEIRFIDAGLEVGPFLALARRVRPREYDSAAAARALDRTINIGAWDGGRLVGVVRVLSDGYFFATVPEIFVDPDYRGRGIGRELMHQALAAAPRPILYFGAQPQSLGFFERIGAERGPVGMILRGDRSAGDATSGRVGIP